MKTTDQEILKRIAHKDEKALKIIYDRYSRLFYKWALMRLNNEEAASDVTQEFWIEVWSSAEKIPCNDVGCAKDFLLRRLSFRIIDYLRIQCKRLEISDDMLSQLHSATLGYSHVQEDVDFKELQQMINDILRCLPSLIQEVYKLRNVENLSTKETASKLGIAESTVYNSLSTAMSTLRRELPLRYNVCNDKIKVLIPLLILLLENRGK